MRQGLTQGSGFGKEREGDARCSEEAGVPDMGERISQEMDTGSYVWYYGIVLYGGVKKGTGNCGLINLKSS